MGVHRSGRARFTAPLVERSESGLCRASLQERNDAGDADAGKRKFASIEGNAAAVRQPHGPSGSQAHAATTPLDAGSANRMWGG